MHSVFAVLQLVDVAQMTDYVEATTELGALTVVAVAAAAVDASPAAARIGQRKDVGPAVGLPAAAVATAAAMVAAVPAELSIFAAERQAAAESAHATALIGLVEAKVLTGAVVADPESAWLLADAAL